MPSARHTNNGKATRRVAKWIALSVGVVVVAIATYVVITQMRTAPRYQPADVVTYSTRTPEETQPDETYAWKGEATDPKKIAIPSIGVDGYLQNVGVDQAMLMAVPNNIHVGGWFVNSVKPGEKGLSIIDGHVDGVTSRSALFSNLHKVAQGDIVEITAGDDTTRRFEVVRTVETTASDAPLTLYSQEPGIAEQLTLITCTGTYESDAQTYDKRFIVITKLIK